MSRNNTPWNWKGKDFPRVISLLEFEKFVKDNDLECSKGLSINGMDPEWYSLPAESVTKVDYTDDKINHDLHRLNLPEKDYDFVIVNQTLEHVYDPVRCLEKIYDHMRPGGILYFNVPANSIPHSTPYHYYTGFTPVGIGAIAMIAGFEILSIGQWGNLEYLNKMQESRKWPDYTVLENPGYNDVHSPVITWIFCRKK
jgi:SAM-dependent methyltransferase